MTNIEILTKVIKKVATSKEHPYPFVDLVTNAGFVEFMLDNDKHYSLLFDHYFARGFWGEKNVTFPVTIDVRENGCTHTTTQTMPAWKHHIQLMALEENPLKYCEKFL